MRTYLTIPAGEPLVHGDVNCMSRKTIHPFAFRTHGHQWATVIKGFKYNMETQDVEEIAAANPQWPQFFYPIKKKITVKEGEFLMARCTFNNSDGNTDIHIGKTFSIYLMFYYHL